MSFGVRLAEERRRMGLRQTDFARLAATDSQKQSLYENDRRDLRGDYLARLAGVGVDIGYVLTGERSDGAWLDPGARELLSAYLALSPEMRAALTALARTMRDEAAPAPTLHARRTAYRGETPSS